MDSCPQGSVIATHVARHSNAVLRRAQDINVNNDDRIKLFQINFYNNIVMGGGGLMIYNIAIKNNRNCNIYMYIYIYVYTITKIILFEIHS